MHVGNGYVHLIKKPGNAGLFYEVLQLH